MLSPKKNCPQYCNKPVFVNLPYSVFTDETFLTGLVFIQKLPMSKIILLLVDAIGANFFLKHRYLLPYMNRLANEGLYVSDYPLKPVQHHCLAELSC